jgi:uncharacterized integral membrane protein
MAAAGGAAFVAGCASRAMSVASAASSLSGKRCCRSAAAPAPAARSATRRRSVTAASTHQPDSKAAAVIDGPYDGHYGQWYLTQGDVDGVALYRRSLAACAALIAAGVVGGLSGVDVPARVWDALYFAAAGSFAVSLATIHIYLKPAHNFLKALHGGGVLASAVLALALASGDTAAGLSGGLVTEVLAKPELMLAVGWQFVALTGLFFKEAVCFQRTEALALGVLVPVLTGGHFLRVLPVEFEVVGSVMFSALFIVFAARKFQQDPRDDLGDKSVFDRLESGGAL